jgi:hypothetical protein
MDSEQMEITHETADYVNKKQLNDWLINQSTNYQINPKPKTRNIKRETQNNKIKTCLQNELFPAWI